MKSGLKNKGIAKANKEKRREEAEARNAKYAALSYAEKMKTAGKKVQEKLNRVGKA
jgi:hypothetical protein